MSDELNDSYFMENRLFLLNLEDKNFDNKLSNLDGDIILPKSNKNSIPKTEIKEFNFQNNITIAKSTGPTEQIQIQNEQFLNNNNKNKDKTINTQQKVTKSKLNNQSTKPKIKKYRPEYNRKKSMTKFKNCLYDFIRSLFLILGFKLQKFYIKNQYGTHKDANKLFLEKKIKDVIIKSIPKRIPKTGNKNHNKKIIDDLNNKKNLDEEKEKIRIILITILEMTIEEMYNKYINNDKNFIIYQNFKIIYLNLEYFEEKYNCRFRTFKDDKERIDDQREREEYDWQAKNLTDLIKGQKKGFTGRPSIRGPRLKK